MNKKANAFILIGGMLGLVFAIYPLLAKQTNHASLVHFDGERAYQDVLTQLTFGPRFPGSEGHVQQLEWMKTELTASGWLVETQALDYGGCPIVNVVAERNPSADSWILLGAHYDTRELSDQEIDLDKRQLPGLGANDGASGVAILLELARVLPSDLDKHISLVFFDCEDNGGIDSKDWALGSQAYVDALSEYPDKVIIVDMVGDADLQIYRERGSNELLMNEIWTVAGRLDIKAFINEPKHHLIDDHTAFVNAGVPAIDLIDFDYPHWHTLADTADKVSVSSLQAVGDVLFAWINQK